MTSGTRYECDLCGESFESGAAKGGHMNKHTKRVPPTEKLLAIREVAAELDHTPTQSEMDEHGEISHYAVTDEFGTWNEGVRAAGLEPAQKGHHSDEEIRRAIRDVADRLGRVPSMDEMIEHGDCSVDAVSRAFGSWTEGVCAAGFQPASETRTPMRRVSHREIVMELRSLAEELGRAPCARDVNDYGSVSAQIVRERFESFDAAVRDAGLTPYHPKQENAWTKTELVRSLRRVACEQGAAPTVKEAETLDGCSPRAARRLFGTWNDALRAAGLTPRLRSRVPTEELLAEIESLAEKLGRPPRWADNRREGRFSVTTYQKRFGSWVKTLQAAGYDPKYASQEREWHGPTGDIEARYGGNWPRQRRRALERDDYRCQDERCSMTEAEHIDQYGYGLDVHHRKPLRTFHEGDEVDHERANRLDNLVTLCRPHHAEWEHEGRWE